MRHSQKLMGNRFEFCVLAHDEFSGQEHIDAAVQEVQRIEALLTTFHENSQTNLINRNAGIKPVKVDREVFDLIYRANKISELTQGAFDITYGGVDKRLWIFDSGMTSLPDRNEARQRKRLINYRKIELDAAGSTVFLREMGMRISFGAIGKGYAADKVKQLLKRRGVGSGIVNAAGDLITWGNQPDGKPWTIGIADPESVCHPFSYLELTDRAIATSGTYEKFIMIEGKRYSHTIDPRTGMPIRGIKSVSIISPTAELSDALATPVMVMGIGVGLDMINQLKGVECLVIDDFDKLYTSKNINVVV